MQLVMDRVCVQVDDGAYSRIVLRTYSQVVLQIWTWIKWGVQYQVWEQVNAHIEAFVQKDTGCIL